MKRLFSALVLTIAATTLSAQQVPGVPQGGALPRQASPANEAIASMPIEVCFVLDTTGSMSGLIKGAQQKIWSIANSIIKDNPKSNLKIALVPYRDRGDEYVTRVFDLTDDLDAMYKELMAFQANGGGDGPESVNQALQDAVEKISWGNGGKDETIRIVFLVGDYPPHMDYADDVKYPETISKGVNKHLIVNAIQCGDHGPTTPIWQDIARLGSGEFLQIAQTGGVVAIATPQDKRLAELSADLARTVVGYGDHAQQSAVAGKNSLNMATASEASAARTSFNISGGGGRGAAVSGKGDLTHDIQSDKSLLGKVKDEELPENLKKMTPEERQAFIDKQIAQRKAINEEIAKVSGERDAYIKAELAKTPAKADAFDTRVTETIHNNAAAARAAAAQRQQK